MGNFVDACRFNPTLGGTTDWTFSTAVQGYQSPASANIINGLKYNYRAESADLSSWELGQGSYNTGTGVLARTTIFSNSSGTTAKISFAVAPQVGIVALAQDVIRGVPGIQNGTIVVSGTTSSTRSLKTLAGNDPSVVDPVFATFPDGSQAVITAALSLTIPSTGTLGTVGGVPFRIWDCLINDAGTIRLGVRRCSDANGTYGYPASGSLSSTIITTPNAVGTTYTSVAVAAKPYLLLGHSTYEAGQSVAGTWATAPSPYVIYAPGIPRAGEPTGNATQFTTTSPLTNTTASYLDSALTASIQPSSAANLVATSFAGSCQLDTAAHYMLVALRRGGSIIGTPQRFGYGAANMMGPVSASWMDAPGSSGSLIYVVSITLDSTGATAFFMSVVGGGVLQLSEIMG